MAALRTQVCDGQTLVCNLDGVECGCEDGQWRCYITSQGAGPCLPCEATGAPGFAPPGGGVR